MTDPEEQVANTEPRQANGYGVFALKTAIVVGAVSLGIVFAAATLVDSINLQPLKTSLRKAFQDEKTRLRLRGLLTNNPAVHFKVSLIEERRGDFKQAIEELELGIGLLELHSADKAVRDRFAERIKSLKAQTIANEGKK